MISLSRKKFLLSGLSLLAIPLFSFSETDTVLKLSFSTLGCPDWPLEKIMDFARDHGYMGIEVRGILREMNLTRVPEFSNAEALRVTLQKMQNRGLSFTDLGSSAAMHLSLGEERSKNLDEAKQFIDLAEKLGCPFIRVFPNQLPKERDKQESLNLIIAGLRELGDYAAGKNVTVLLESHGELIYTRDLLMVMKGADHPQVGLVWDICNMWVATKERPEEVYAVLKPYIRHTHIKDCTLTGDKIDYVLLGTGVVPIFTAIDLLYRNQYSGYYSFEWEKLWHPEIADPEIAIADYAVVMRKHFEK